MGVEDVATSSGASTITDYGLGARGVDYIAATKSGTTTVGFPIYDCHGNMTACLFRSGTNYYSLGNQRHYDAWGVIRSGAATGDPKSRYCASLAHKQDDESGLLYMRSRYYEPISGRFISDDSSKNGHNWQVYCSDDPINHVDKTGAETASADWFVLGMLCLTVAGCLVTFNPGSAASMNMAIFLTTCAFAAFVNALDGCRNVTNIYGPEGGHILAMLSAVEIGIITAICVSMELTGPTVAAIAVDAVGAYGLMCAAAMHYDGDAVGN